MDRKEFFAHVCTRMGWAPTPWRIAVLEHWAGMEGMPFDRTWNPLATTRLSDATPLDETFDIGFGPGNWNHVPVRVYHDAEAGVTATVETLSLGYYANLRRCFAEQAPNEGAAADLRTYVGSDAYGAALLAFMGQCAEAKSAERPLEERVARLERIIAGNGIDVESGRLTGEAALADLDARGVSVVLGLTQAQVRIASLDGGL